MSPLPTTLSTTRSLWFLLQGGERSYMQSKQFVCPSTNDTFNQDWRRMAYWDFGDGDITDPPTVAESRTGWYQVSYGYQVPYGRHGRPTTDREGSMAVAADQGPFGAAIDGGRMAPPPITAMSVDPPDDWRPWNSLNHGRDGQNVLRIDGSARWYTRPISGAGNDNIYTQWGATGDAARDREQGNPPTAGGRETPVDDNDTLIYP